MKTKLRKRPVAYKNFYKKIYLFFLTIVFSSFCFLFFWKIALSFVVKEIKGEKLDFSIYKKYINKPILTANLSYLYNYLKQNPIYKKILILKKFPSTIEIIVEKRKPFAQIKNSLFYLIDEEGSIIEQNVEKFEEIPIILIENFKKEKDLRIDIALELLSYLKKTFYFSSLDYIDASNFDFLIFSLKGKKIILPRKELKEKFKLFETIWLEINQKKILVNSLDLRFEKPYIK